MQYTYEVLLKTAQHWRLGILEFSMVKKVSHTCCCCSVATERRLSLCAKVKWHQFLIYSKILYAYSKYNDKRVNWFKWGQQRKWETWWNSLVLSHVPRMFSGRVGEWFLENKSSVYYSLLPYKSPFSAFAHFLHFYALT